MPAAWHIGSRTPIIISAAAMLRGPWSVGPGSRPCRPSGRGRSKSPTLQIPCRQRCQQPRWPDNWGGAPLLAHLPVSVDDVLVAAQFYQTAWPACMEFISTDAYFRPLPKLVAVVEACTGVDHDGRGIKRGRKATGGCQVVGDDGLRVLRPVARDVFDGLLQAVHDLDRQDEVEVFRSEVGVGRGFAIRQPAARGVAAAQLHT